MKENDTDYLFVLDLPIPSVPKTYEVKSIFAVGSMVITELWMITRGARDEGEEQETGIQANFYVNEVFIKVV